MVPINLVLTMRWEYARCWHKLTSSCWQPPHFKYSGLQGGQLPRCGHATRKRVLTLDGSRTLHARTRCTQKGIL